MSCEHKFVFIRNHSYYTWISRYTLKYVSVDYFFCEKCLEYHEIKKEAQVSDSQKDILPEWARLITYKLPSEYSI
jgi:hypothetical protein